MAGYKDDGYSAMPQMDKLFIRHSKEVKELTTRRRAILPLHLRLYIQSNKIESNCCLPPVSKELERIEKASKSTYTALEEATCTNLS